MKAKKRREATPLDLVRGYRVSDDDEETEEVGSIAELMHLLNQVDESSPEAEANEVGMKDSSGRAVKFNEARQPHDTVGPE
jgi:hypothetical protein